ncbi:hypothetical protein [Brucella tritici]|uniref:hypothetical protein n=1 Tax=Brucella tritici TaxID=94626 RepID=UPI003D6D36B3
MKLFRVTIGILFATAMIAPQIAEARGGFGGRMPRMNLGGGGMHGFGGGFHGPQMGGFNGPAHFAPRFNPSMPRPRGGNVPHVRTGPSLHPAHHPAPGPHPAPNPTPHPAPKPHPGPGPAPHPGPGPHPVPPPPPPPPPPGPYWPGYWDGGWGPAAAAIVGTAAAVAIGSVIANVPPDCTNVVVNGISYKDCNGNWFEPKYNGHSVVYVAVTPPK